VTSENEDVEIRTDKYRHLPRRIPLEDTVEVQDADPPRDPTMGRDAERDFILRNAGG